MSTRFAFIPNADWKCEGKKYLYWTYTFCHHLHCIKYLKYSRGGFQYMGGSRFLGYMQILRHFVKQVQTEDEYVEGMEHYRRFL